MELSITTDYANDLGDPSPYLKRIADAGFTHVHWCHHWNTDFLYSEWEIAQIKKWLADYGLKLLDLHGSMGKEKRWASPREYERFSGVELVKNRLDMAARLQSDIVIMHIPAWPEYDPLRKSLDDLMKFSRQRGVQIALENLGNGNFEAIRNLLSEYDHSYLGFCYDSGHGNISGQGLECLDALKDRLIAVHLHDNDGSADQHKLIFSGTIDWERLAKAITESAYKKCVSLEVGIENSGIENESDFLRNAFDVGKKFTEMIQVSIDRRN